MTGLSRTDVYAWLGGLELDGQVITRPEGMEAFRRDQCLMAEAGAPMAVVKAGSTSDVVTILRGASRLGVPVVTRGAGSGLAGGANAIDGGIVLTVADLDRVLSIDPVTQTARVEPGVINQHLDAAARAHALFYAPDPGSRSFSTIGGNIATNAGGMCCAKYGVTRDHLLSVRLVTGDGEVVTLGRGTAKDVVGLDLLGLVAGSEGTLGVVIEATVGLLPVQSELVTVAATFPSTREACLSVERFRRVGVATAMELMDRATLRAVDRLTKMGLDADGALVLAQFDGAEGPSLAQRYQAEAEAGGAEVFLTSDPVEGVAMMEARRLAYPALEALGSTLLDDVCVPIPQIADLISTIEEIAESSKLLIGTFGHAGDGNLHPTIVFDAGDEDARSRAGKAFNAVVEQALAVGGTLSGEHGVGSLKHPMVGLQLGEPERALMHRVKAAFDPAGVLNPGRAY
jgi:glycolate oxidase subunit GlcD